MGPSVKALALFFTSLAVAKPISQPRIVARGSSSVESTASTTLSLAASTSAQSNTATASSETILQDGVISATSTVVPSTTLSLATSNSVPSNTVTANSNTIQLHSASPGISGTASATTPTGSSTSSLDASVTIPQDSSATAATSTASPTALALATNFTDLCSQDYTSALWEQYDLDAYILEEAAALQPFNSSFQQALINMLPGLQGKDYTCGFDQPCVTYAVTQVCTENPRAAFVLLAMAHFSNYFQTIFSTIETAVITMTPAFATFPETFNPTNITVLPSSSETGILASAAWLLGSMVGLGGMIATEIGATAGTLQTIGNIGGITYTVGSFATVAGLNGTSPDASVEVEFDSFAAIEGTLSEMQHSLTTSISDFVISRLGDTPVSAADEVYQYDATQLPQLLLSGAFAAPIGDLGPNVISGFTAALAAPGINELWNYQSAVVVKVSKASLPTDPCEGDNLALAANKYCDADGNAFLIHVPAPAAGGATTGYQLPINNISLYDAPGINKIDEYNLTVQAITQSAWNLQQTSGAYSSGPSMADLNSYIMNTGVDNLQLEDYVFFNFPVCDMDNLPISSGENTQIMDTTCGADGSTQQNGDPTVCTYLLKMTCLCNLGNYGSSEQWPWTGNSSLECIELSSY